MLLNLLGNAIKFTERGSVALDVVPLARDAARIDVRFAVRDTGIGIPTGAAASAVQRFTQADGSTTRRFGGTGLGLAISKRSPS